MERWPERLWIVRHGQSAGNVAADAAYAAGLSRINLDMRDVDVELSDLGKQQAAALGKWFAALPDDAGPEIILSSPFVRARQTAHAVADAIAAVDHHSADERLREREFGILDRLTRAGVIELHPDQAAALTMLGKFYHRPPGGEAWTDVILRLRAMMDTMMLQFAGRRVLIVAHQVVVLCLRYVLETMDEHEVLAVDALGDVANCSITEYSFGDGPTLVRYNETAPLEEAAAPVTSAPDKAVAAG